jgi:hypothetical protein
MMEKEGEIRYWRAIHNDVDEEMKNLDGILLVLHDSIEFTQLIDFFNKIKSNHFTNVLYVSLTRSHDYMRHALEQKPLDQKRVFFIDCVSGFAFPVEENIDRVLYHKPPRDLHTMKEIIHYGIEKTNPDIVIIDSLSQLINFSKPTGEELDEFYNFLHDLRKQEISMVCNTFILLFDAKMGALAHLPSQGIDTILKLEMSKPTKLPLETSFLFGEKKALSSELLH